ncbi:TPA: hypothetical protein ACSW15_002726 [Enterobacter hormaechei]|uniref:hypothetical protein n=1 Tax=Enterobacter cloacae complex TaxID=354276 RepID=UPI00064AB030|nr:hypothetical protein [Enterobacter hormaechei]EJB8193928.1 hypothetical protein [Enterobacter hormaechei]EKU5340214.1 hypothetical protein [Enterobacter hormaechei]EKU5345031.1 hypothetical protein [Enterobacter hormaechei]EKU5421548.1 hypothetical protein [Enterobacter hormaechei]EKX8240287.1 hypothetical protein [Enterobacter hormaechei]
MKRISFFLLFVTIPSIADELTYSNYFREFTVAFTPPVISAGDYSKLSSYKLHPELFIDFGKSPPESFGNNDLHNSNVIFNGAASKKFFINFVNSSFLNGDALDEIEKKFTDKNGSYTFRVEIKDGRVVILENMLISAPESMTAEFSCSYTFDTINKEPLKLTDVLCAG